MKVDEVYYQGHTVLLEKNGKPAAIVVTLEIYHSWQAKREKDFATIRQIRDEIQGEFTEEETMSLA